MGRRRVQGTARRLPPFDRLFAQRYPDMYRMLVITLYWAEDHQSSRERIVEGRRYEDIEKDIFKAVAKITNGRTVA